MIFMRAHLAAGCGCAASRDRSAAPLSGAVIPISEIENNSEVSQRQEYLPSSIQATPKPRIELEEAASFARRNKFPCHTQLSVITPFITHDNGMDDLNYSLIY
jgi:hypothetical protein